jgi:hypothetical protein
LPWTLTRARRGSSGRDLDVNLFVGATAVLAADSGGVSADDQGTGEERWRHEFTPERGAEVVTTTDGAVAPARLSDAGPSPDVLVDVASGHLTRLVDPPAAVEVGLGPAPVLRDRTRDALVHAIDPTTGRAVPLDVAGCPLTRAAVTTALPPIAGLPHGMDARFTHAPGALVVGVPGSRERPGPVVGFVP